MYRVGSYRGTSLIRNSCPPLGPPERPRLSPTVGSQGGKIFYERGTTVPFPAFLSVFRVSDQGFRERGFGSQISDFGRAVEG